MRFDNIGDSTDGDYVLFTDQGTGCSSNVGRVGGSQTVTLPKFEFTTCQHLGIILHEIGHAVGFWHEQSRPDRDRHVRILEENISFGFEHNFLTRCECSINYEGGRYDYGSIMHYSLNAFANGSVDTIEIINQEEYEQQGSPSIGQRENLSPGDIFQLNRMYDCLPTSRRGDLKIIMREASDVSGYFAESELYALVTATDESGQKLSRFTSGIPSTRSPLWNEYLSFGSSRWRYFDISIRERSMNNAPGMADRSDDCFRDTSTNNETDAEVICKQTIWVSTSNDSNAQPTYSGPLNYCTNVSTCVYFEYELTLNDQPCYPNPCYNGGMCKHTFAGYTCDCRSGYVGRQCERVIGGSCDASYVCNNCRDAYNEMCLGGN